MGSRKLSICGCYFSWAWLLSDWLMAAPINIPVSVSPNPKEMHRTGTFPSRWSVRIEYAYTANSNLSQVKGPRSHLYNPTAWCYYKILSLLKYCKCKDVIILWCGDLFQWFLPILFFKKKLPTNLQMWSRDPLEPVWAELHNLCV